MPKTQDKKIHLAAFVTAGPGRPGGWRYPASESGWLDADYYQGIARTLERGLFDLAFFADILAVPDRYQGSNDTQLRYGALGSLRLDPVGVLSIMAAATKHLGLASTRSTSHYEDPHAGLSTLSYHLDVDLSAYPLDAELPDINVPGVQGHYQEVREATDRDRLTLRDLGKRYGSC